jgi:hypothetical protein
VVIKTKDLENFVDDL